MACYIVTYDLNKENKRPNILKDVKSYGTWAKLSESSYAIVTSDSCKAVYDNLSKHLDSDDNCYIVSLRKPFYGRGPNDVNEWLVNNLPG